MNFKNQISCPHCGNLNFDYDFKCNNCKSFVRDRIVNIDLGEILLSLIDNPSESFHKIKLAEHKNYVIIIALLLSIRFLIISRFISVPFTTNEVHFNLFLLVGISIMFLFFLLILLSALLKKMFSQIKIRTRYKDIFAILTYSFVPNLLALVILFPIELVFYGEYLFSNNPYPYQIKESIFYFLLVLEILTILWSVFLLAIGMNEFLKSRFLSFTFSAVIWILIFILLFLQSKIFLIH